MNDAELLDRERHHHSARGLGGRGELEACLFEDVAEVVLERDRERPRLRVLDRLDRRFGRQETGSPVTSGGAAVTRGRVVKPA